MTRPIVLLDQPDDMACEERGWVSTDVSDHKARDLLEPFCCDSDGYGPARPIGPAKRVWLHVRNPDAPHADEHRWFPCDPGQTGAVEFWELDATHTAPAQKAA